MPVITAINLQTKIKDRCNLFLDGEYYTSVTLETVMKNRLKVGLEIEKDKLAEIITENEKAEALNKAVGYISKYLKTKREIKDYLLRKGYSEEVAWYCIDKLKEYGYVNDQEYSKRFIESNSKNQGKRLLEYKLMMKGVKKEDIGAAYENAEIDAKENAKAIAEKHLKNKEITSENLAKTYRYLIGKGFSYEEASYAIDQMKGEN